jgi:predicted nucleic acid-binding protein
VKIVADTGPIIGLAKIGQISLLKKLATEVLIPPIVHKELYGKIGSESDQIDQALSNFVHVVELGSLELNIDEPLINLGEGEKQCIFLASTLKKEVLLLIDDRAGRQAADNLKISKIGLVGILLLVLCAFHLCLLSLPVRLPRSALPAQPVQLNPHAYRSV